MPRLKRTAQVLGFIFGVPSLMLGASLFYSTASFVMEAEPADGKVLEVMLEDGEPTLRVEVRSSDGTTREARVDVDSMDFAPDQKIPLLRSVKTGEVNINRFLPLWEQSVFFTAVGVMLLGFMPVVDLLQRRRSFRRPST